MKIEQFSIDWEHDCDNYPEPRLVVDAIPKREDYQFRLFKSRRKGLLKDDCYWFGEKDGVVLCWKWTGPENEGGFAGREWPITMEDGSVVVLKGPWHAGIPSAEYTGVGPCISATMIEKDKLDKDPRHAAWFGGMWVTADLIRPYVEAAGAYLVKAEYGHTISLAPDRLVKEIDFQGGRELKDYGPCEAV